MEKVNAATLKWSKEEHERLVEKLKLEEQEKFGMFHFTFSHFFFKQII
jgi:hypothetical protein